MFHAKLEQMYIDSGTVGGSPFRAQTIGHARAIDSTAIEGGKHGLWYVL
jgi:hypothetical protein